MIYKTLFVKCAYNKYKTKEKIHFLYMSKEKIIIHRKKRKNKGKVTFISNITERRKIKKEYKICLVKVIYTVFRTKLFDEIHCN